MCLCVIFDCVVLEDPWFYIIHLCIFCCSIPSGTTPALIKYLSCVGIPAECTFEKATPDCTPSMNAAISCCELCAHVWMCACVHACVCVSIPFVHTNVAFCF